MIKINIIAVGKIKESFYTQAINEYLKRISKYAQVNIIEIKEETLSSESESERERIISLEGDSILKATKGTSIAMAIEGEKLNSVKLADLIKKHTDNGEVLSFIIGGSYGLDKRVKDMAKYKLSFSDMTFPHQLFRVMLIEQIYRAFTIINGATYHK